MARRILDSIVHLSPLLFLGWLSLTRRKTVRRWCLGGRLAVLLIIGWCGPAAGAEVKTDEASAAKTAETPSTAAQAPDPARQFFRFERPQVIQVVRLWPVPCRAWRPLDERCLEVDVAVLAQEVDVALLAQDGARSLAWETPTYSLEGPFFTTLWRDFGPFTAVAFRRIAQALEKSGALQQDAMRPQALAVQTLLEKQVRYRVLAEVIMPLDVEMRVSRLADLFFRKTGQTLVVTSGTRTPHSQAAAMFTMLNRRANLRRLYRKTEAAMAVKRAYGNGWGAKKKREAIIRDMAHVIQQQVDQGLYLSPHLKAGAVDIRSRTMSRRTKRIFRRVAESFPDLKLNREEKRPPHFHMEVHTERWEAD